jgi:glycosyltransferase involved in cell wall biosynthesis
MNYLKKVMIGTPSHDGRVDVWYANSLVNTVRICEPRNIFLNPVSICYDSLIQRARNDCIKIAVEGDYDCLIFIDSDMEWQPEWVVELIDRSEDIVGGTCRKKTDEAELYAIKTRNINKSSNGLIEVESIGTGFVKLSRNALRAIWEASEPYTNGDRHGRMCCNVIVKDGELVSEDIVLFERLRELGFSVWLDPKMCCVHIGVKKFYGNLEAFIEKLQNSKG